MAKTTVICDDPEVIDSFSWEDVLDASPSLKRNPHNPSVWSLPGQFDISANGKEIAVHPWDDKVRPRFCLLATEWISSRYKRWTEVTVIDDGGEFEVYIYPKNLLHTC